MSGSRIGNIWPRKRSRDVNKKIIIKKFFNKNIRKKIGRY